MGYWRYSNITVTGDARIDFNTEVCDKKEDIIKLFTDEDLETEIQNRKDGKSKHENRINKLNTYVYNVDVDVYTDDVLNEVDNTDLIQEVESRNLNIEDSIDVEKHELRKTICKTLKINEMYEDEEIFEMLREIWRTKR